MTIQKDFIKNGLQNQFELLDFEGIVFQRAITYLRIQDLVRPSYSNRVPIDNQVITLVKSLTSFGFLGGIFVEETTNQVIDGWHRTQAWAALGNNTIPCYLITCSPIQEKSLHLALNRQVATFQPSEFGIEFDGLDLKNDFGFTEADFMPQSVEFEAKFAQPQKSVDVGFAKLSTLLPASTYDLLRFIKRDLSHKSIADTITYLAEFHESR